MQSHLQALREAVHSRHMVQIDYADVHGRPSLRRLRPLGCFYWGKVWTLSAWCKLRNDFRGFRIDRIVGLVVLEEQFRQEPGKTLADLLRKVEAEMEVPPMRAGDAPGCRLQRPDCGPPNHLPRYAVATNRAGQDGLLLQ